MSRTVGRAAHFGGAKNVTLRRETIVIAVALLLLAAAIPFAIMETIEKGRVYLFSKQFLEELPQRFTGPGRFRFILQPMIALFLGIRGNKHRRTFGLHAFRLGLGTALSDSKVSPKTVQHILRHTDIKTTFCYVHSDLDAQRTALAGVLIGTTVPIGTAARD
jgi:integrase